MDSHLMAKDNRRRSRVKIGIVKVPPLGVEDKEAGVKHGSLQTMEVSFHFGVISSIQIMRSRPTLIVVGRHGLLASFEIHHGYIHRCA